MYYPWLDVPFLTAPMLIALVATIHVFISHYAVGGGLLLALENVRGVRDGDAEYRSYWKKHAKFFILSTVVLGAITGVGIWFAIGLASPLATETLIRIFVFGWAIEWCFFILEVVAGFVFYYFWDKLSPNRHCVVGAIYAASAWISLLLITGITSFMSNSSGLFNDWEKTGSFWDAFLNVQFLPQTVARTGGALIMGALYVLFHAAVFEKNGKIRAKVTRGTRVPAFLGVFLLVAGAVGWAFFLPESSLATLERAAAANVFSALFVAIIVGIVLLLLVGPVARPGETTPAFALALLLLGIAGIAVAEFVREAVRKPYVVDRVIYGNQIFRADVARLRENGLLYEGVWTRLYLDEIQKKYPNLKISAKNYLGWEPTRPDYWNKIEELKQNSELEAEEFEFGGSPNETAPKSSENADALYFASIAENSVFVLETAARTRQSGGAPTFRGGVLPNPEPASSRQNPPTSAAPEATASRSRPLAETPVVSPRPLATVDANRRSQRLTPTSELFPTSISADAPSQRRGNFVPIVSPSVSTVPSNDDSASVSFVAPPSVSTVPPNDDSASVSFAAPPSVSTVSPNVDSVALEMKTNEDAENDAFADRDLLLNGPIGVGNRDLSNLEPEDRRALGRVVFLHHCNDCHAAERGYSALGPLVAGRTRAELTEFALRLNRPNFYMPPWCGTEVEAELLAEYLASIASKYPANINRKPIEKASETDEENDLEIGSASSANDATRDTAAP